MQSLREQDVPVPDHIEHKVQILFHSVQSARVTLKLKEQRDQGPGDGCDNNTGSMTALEGMQSRIMRKNGGAVAQSRGEQER